MKLPVKKRTNYYSPRTIRKAVTRIWPRLASFLRIEPTWDEFVAGCRKKFKNFQGLKLRKTRFVPCWSAGFEREKRGHSYLTYLYIYYPLQDRTSVHHFDHNICHGLVHVFRATIHQNRFRSACLIRYFLEEALCNVIATKVLNERGTELITQGLHSIIEICALEQMIYSLNEEEIRRLAFMPRNENEARELASLIMKWTALQQFERSYDSVWHHKIKAKVDY